MNRINKRSIARFTFDYAVLATLTAYVVTFVAKLGEFIAA